MITRQRVIKIIALLQQETKYFTKPMVSLLIQEFGHDPFLILISCLLSLRSRDTSTLPVCRQLFGMAKTPEGILSLSQSTIEKILYPLGFYRKKALVLQAVSREIIQQFNGQIPRTREELLSLSGVGRKTANLVLGQGFGIQAICVDIHVHRISNRLGLVQTKTPEQTEQALERIIPKEYWIEWNSLLVMWGQNVCVPISPWCSQCPLLELCDQVRVKKSR